MFVYAFVFLLLVTIGPVLSFQPTNARLGRAPATQLFMAQASEQDAKKAIDTLDDWNETQT